MQTTIKRHHPKSLPYLFLTEMWERFGFYVVQGMLVLYLTESFGFSDDRSYAISGAFTALAYISPIVGGLLADKLLGFKTAIIWGIVFLIIGYALLAQPWFPKTFYIALATIIVGVGLLKPNISSLLGAMYDMDDPNRDSGFTIFYIGINFGILFAGLGSGFIKDYFGWHAGFGLASLGLVIGLITFNLGLKEFKHLTTLKQSSTALAQLLVILGCIPVIAIFSYLLQSIALCQWLLSLVGVFLLIFLFIFTLKQEPYFRRRLFTLNMLILSSVIFWMIYWQMFLSVNLFIDRLIDKYWFGIHIPTTAFYTLEALFIIILGPALAWSWQTLNQSNRNPSSLLKFVLAIFLVGLAFVTLTLSTYFPNAEHLINPLWIVLSYFLITLGEMLLSPIGLSAVTILAPPHLVGLMMGIWFVSLGFGGQFAGILAKFSSIHKSDNLMTVLQTYRSAFLIYACLAFAVALILFFIQLRLRKILELAD